MKWRYNHERNRNNKFRHARIRQRRVVSADRGQRGHPRGCAAEGERNTEGANEMRKPKFKFDQKVIGVGSDNIGIVGAVIGTNVSKPAWKVIVSVCDNNGSLSFAEGREHTWEVIG